MKEYGSYLKKPFLCVFSLALMLISTTAFGRTIRVPEDYSTIQNGINAAQAGDTVLVAPGTYVENIDFLGKAITVTSEGKRATTIIDGGRVRFVSGETRDSVLVGFTVQNTAGRSIDIIDSSPTIIDNIMNNGGGITIESGSPLIQGNLITNNAAGLPGGGGIYIGFGSAEIISNTISNNTASVPGVGGGIYTDIFRGGLIRDNIIIGNTAGDGAGIYIRDASFSKIVQNLIIENSATSKGGGIALDTPYTVSPLFLNNTIADNHADLGSAFYSNGLNSGASLINNIIIGAEGEIAFFCGNFGNPMPVLEFNNVFSPMADTYGDNCIDPTGSNGNISLDPLFVESTNGDYHLTANSPCIDAGTNNTADLPAIDFESGPRILDGDNDGTATVDMGVDEYVWMPKAMPWIPLLLGD